MLDDSVEVAKVLSSRSLTSRLPLILEDLKHSRQVCILMHNLVQVFPGFLARANASKRRQPVSYDAIGKRKPNICEKSAENNVQKTVENLVIRLLSPYLNFKVAFTWVLRQPKRIMEKQLKKAVSVYRTDKKWHVVQQNAGLKDAMITADSYWYSIWYGFRGWHQVEKLSTQDWCKEKIN